MILEVEYLVEEIRAALELALVDAAIQVPSDDEDERIVTTVVPSWADGGVVFLDGAFDLDTIARAIANVVPKPTDPEPG